MILTAAQLAELLDCSVERVNEEAAAGRLPGLKLGRSWVFPARAVEDALNARAAENLSRRVVPLATAVSRPAGRRRAPPALPAVPQGLPPAGSESALKDPNAERHEDG